MKIDIIWEKDNSGYSFTLVAEDDTEQVLLEMLGKGHDHLKIKKRVNLTGDVAIHTVELHPVDKPAPATIEAEIQAYTSGESAIYLTPKTDEAWGLLDLWVRLFRTLDFYKAGSYNSVTKKTTDLFCVKPNPVDMAVITEKARKEYT